MKKGLVSIISPCYNGEAYVSNFLNSVLGQTYKNIEVIMINDGSSDRTEKILKQYEGKFAQKGYSYICVTQENRGQAAAINVGLAKYSGEYLMWVDSDDILLPLNVEKKVSFLKQHSECGFVICQGEVVDSKNLNRVIGRLHRKTPKRKDNLFSDLIFEKNVVFCPGVIMARRKAVEKAIPKNEIFESREGQNWQLMLPLAYYYKCGYIEEVHFKCVAHEDSHSRKKRSYQEMMERNDNFVTLLTQTILRIPDMSEREKQEWISKIYIKHNINKLKLALSNRKIQEVKLIKRKIKENANKYNTRIFLHKYILHEIISNLKGFCYRVLKLPYSLVKNYMLNRKING